MITPLRLDRVHRRLRVEELEPRIAPAGIADYWVDIGPGSASGGGISNTSADSISPTMAVDALGNPIVAWADKFTGSQNVYVRSWNGASWVEMGGSATGAGVSGTATVHSSTPQIATGPTGIPYVVWQEASAGTSGQGIFLRWWDGSVWSALGRSTTEQGIDNNMQKYVGYPAVAAGPDGKLIVAWHGQLTTTTNPLDVGVSFWDGGPPWSAPGNISNNTSQSSSPALAFGSGGNPIIAWADNAAGNYEIWVRTWTGSNWAELGLGAGSGGGISNNTLHSRTPDVVVGPDGKVYVAWMQQTASGDYDYDIYLKCWDGSSWSALGSSATGGGISNDGAYSLSPRVAVGADGRPIVAWESGQTAKYIYVRAWNGTSWAELGPGSASGKGITPEIAGSNRAEAPDIVIGSDGNPIVVWSNYIVGQPRQIFARRYQTPLPTVTIAATDPNASETGPDNGVFTITRTGDTTNPLVVAYTIGGTATNGTDYQLLSGSATIGAGQASTTITLTPIDDVLVEGPETAILTLSTSGAYVIGTAGSATVTIADNDSLPSGQVPLQPGQPKMFTDGDGSGVTILLTGAGSGFFTLRNGLTTGDAIARIVLTNTTEKSALSIKTKEVAGVTVPGTSFDRLQITKADTAGLALGSLSAKGIDLAPTGQIQADGGMKAIVLGNVGPESNIVLQGPLASFTAMGLGDTAILDVGGGLGTLKVDSVGEGTQVTAQGGMKTVHVLMGNMNGTISALDLAGIGTVSIPKGGMRGALVSLGWIKTVTVGGGNLDGSLTSSGPDGIGTVSIPKGGFTGTISAQSGGVKTVTVGGGNAGGAIMSNGEAGIGTINVPKGGLDSAVISATHVTGAGIKSLLVNGSVANTLIISQGTGGIGKMAVRGNAEMNLIVPNGTLGSFTLSGTTASRLSGAWQVLGIKTFKGTLGEMADFRLTTDAIGSFTVSGSMTGQSSINALALGTLTIQGDLRSDDACAIETRGDLGAKSKILIGGTATYGAGAGLNRIKIGGELDGQVAVGARVLNGLFGDVVVMNAANSSGKLIADQKNDGAVIFADNGGVIVYTAGKTSGAASSVLFGAQAWPET